MTHCLSLFIRYRNVIAIISSFWEHVFQNNLLFLSRHYLLVCVHSLVYLVFGDRISQFPQDTANRQRWWTGELQDALSPFPVLGLHVCVAIPAAFYMNPQVFMLHSKHFTDGAIFPAPEHFYSLISAFAQWSDDCTSFSKFHKLDGGCSTLLQRFVCS